MLVKSLVFLRVLEWMQLHMSAYEVWLTATKVTEVVGSMYSEIGVVTLLTLSACAMVTVVKCFVCVPYYFGGNG